MIKANTSARALNIICNIEEYYIPQRGKSMHHRFRSNAFVVHSSTKYDSLAPAQSVLLYVALRYNRSDIFEHLINEPLVYAVQYIRTVSKRILFETVKNTYKIRPKVCQIVRQDFRWCTCPGQNYGEGSFPLVLRTFRLRYQWIFHQAAGKGFRQCGLCHYPRVRSEIWGIGPAALRQIRKPKQISNHRLRKLMLA